MILSAVLAEVSLGMVALLLILNNLFVYAFFVVGMMTGILLTNHYVSKWGWSS